MVLCSSDVASALSMAGVLDYALNTNLNVDDTGNTFAGLLNGRVKVYIDPYAGANYLTVGYRGILMTIMFYCPYVPLQMVRCKKRILSNQKSDLKQDMVWFLTFVGVMLTVLEMEQTNTTEKLKLLTFCKIKFDLRKGLFGTFFLCTKYNCH